MLPTWGWRWRDGSEVKKNSEGLSSIPSNPRVAHNHLYRELMPSSGMRVYMQQSTHYKLNHVVTQRATLPYQPQGSNTSHIRVSPAWVKLGSLRPRDPIGRS